MWTRILLVVALAVCVTARHTEELYVRPLPHANSVLASFQFSTDEIASEAQSDSLYPAVLRQILTKYDAASLHLSFSVGQYSTARYGSTEHFHAPFGARLQVEFLGHEVISDSFVERWKDVTSELGGLFSASLNQMDETTLVRALEGSSVIEFGAYEANHTSQTHFVQSTLAREELCTENLTPWLKMLPCRAHAGLGTLIDPIRILSGEYAMLSIFASHDAVSGRWQLRQHLTSVQSASGRDESDPWSLGSLFLDSSANLSQDVAGCPLASQSVITTEGYPTNDLKASPTGISTTIPWLKGLTQETNTIQVEADDLVSVHRFQTGHGQVHGGLAVRLENRHSSCPTIVTYNDVLPWYLRVYFHTFQSRLVPLNGHQASDSPTNQAPIFQFASGELRGRPNHLRVQVELPPLSALVLSVQFEKMFVRLSEHPPDANRGFDIPPGVATFTSSAKCGRGPTRVVYSEPLLVALPTPDFSMPYNVITLTSTVVAFFVGSMLNTLLRKAPRIKRILTDKSSA